MYRMKLKILFIILSFPFLIKSQVNLVPNPSFEIYDTCPNTGGQLNYSVNWNIIYNSPDYYNSCAPVATASICSVPKNRFGYQIPDSGNAYAGVWSYATTISNFREVLGAQLSSPLTIGQKYFIKFKLSLSLHYLSNSGSNRTGLRFSNIQHSATNPPPINNVSHIYSNAIITDTLNWTTVFGSFIADSAYGFIEMGNFFDDANTNIQVMWPQGANESYFFIDNVCVSSDSLFTLGWKTEISDLDLLLFPNPSTGKVHIQAPNFEPEEIIVHNLYGIEIKTMKVNSITKDLEFEENGIYIVTLTNGRRKSTKKVIINK